jgi:hypothetical protein
MLQHFLLVRLGFLVLNFHRPNGRRRGASGRLLDKARLTPDQPG